jgi:hypothetical protein
MPSSPSIRLSRGSPSKRCSEAPSSTGPGRIEQMVAQPVNPRRNRGDYCADIGIVKQATVSGHQQIEPIIAVSCRVDLLKNFTGLKVAQHEVADQQATRPGTCSTASRHGSW